jgi:hypothetical protein
MGALVARAAPKDQRKPSGHCQRDLPAQQDTGAAIRAAGARWAVRGSLKSPPCGVRWRVFHLRAGRVAASLQNAQEDSVGAAGAVSDPRVDFAEGLWDPKGVLVR